MNNKVIDSIRLKNFFTHKDSFIEFSDGLNYLVGPEGSGKSLVLEAIAFCLFGTAALRDVASSYKQVEAELIFNYLGVKFKITRKISDAIFYIQNEEDLSWSSIVVGTTPVNQKVISLLGYDYSIFILSNYCQQGDLQSFSKMTPAKKIAFIDKVSGIEDAKEFIKFLEDRKKSLKTEISTTAKFTIPPTPIKDEYLLIENIDDILIELQNKKDLFLNSTIDKLNIENDILKIQSKLTSLNNKVVDKDISDFLFKYSLEQTLEFHKAVAQLAKDINNTESKINQIKFKFNMHDLDNIVYTKQELEKYFKDVHYNESVDLKIKLLSKGDVCCPTCNTTFSLEHKELEDLVDVSTTKIDLPKKIKYPQELYEFILNYKENYHQLKIKLAELLNKKQEIFNYNYLQNISFSQLNNQLVLHIDNEKIFNKESQYYNAQLVRLQQQLESINIDSDAVSDLVLDINNKIYEYTKIKTEVEIYLRSKYLYELAMEKTNQLKQELNLITDLIAKSIEDTFTIKQASIPLINHHASVLLNDMTESVLSKLTITENYDILVDTRPINVCSGSEKDTASLAFRLSLGNSIILGMLPLFLGDEIDAASRMERSLLITDVLQNMSSLGYQVILITHKDTTNFENCNIIDLQGVI